MLGVEETGPPTISFPFESNPFNFLLQACDIGGKILLGNNFILHSYILAYILAISIILSRAFSQASMS